MDTNSIPVILLLLLPGFVTFTIADRRRHISDFETLLWSLLAAFVVLLPTVTVWHLVDSSMPTAGELARNPQAVPLRLAAVLYVVAVPLGILIRSEVIEGPALRLRIDLRRQHDAWTLAFQDPYYLFVYLRGGDLLYGWPNIFSSDRSGKATELYLTDVWVWDADAAEWTQQDKVRGVWLDVTSIERIEFTRHEAAAYTES